MKISRDDRFFQISLVGMFCRPTSPRMLASISGLFFYFAGIPIPAQLISARAMLADNTSTKPPALVIGFVGGYISHDNPVHSEVQLAARLRKEFPTGVDVETYESYRGNKARQKILKLLDTNHDGTLTAEEKRSARIIIYGHSWGGAEAIYVARALEKDGIPVLLTVQIDSICALGRNDLTIPANVAEAANFYQTHGLLRGHHDIHAANPSNTRILGNFEFNYEKSSLTCSEYPWYDRVFAKPHTQIECDPAIWNQVDSLIRARLLS